MPHIYRCLYHNDFGDQVEIAIIVHQEDIVIHYTLPPKTIHEVILPKSVVRTILFRILPRYPDICTQLYELSKEMIDD